MAALEDDSDDILVKSDADVEEILVDGDHAGTVKFIGKINLQDAWLAEVPTGSCKWATHGEAVKWVMKCYKEDNKQ